MKSSLNGDAKESVKEVQSNNQDDLLAIVKDLQNQLNILKAEKKEVKTEDKSYIDILSEDYMENPAVFFAYSSSFSIYGDRKMGQVIPAPNGEGVKFQRAYRYERKNGRRGVEVISTCATTIKSKKMYEWLKGHSLFGIKFFESIKDVENIDVTFAEKMTEVNGQISNMSDMQVIERAQIENVKISQDINAVRKALIEKIAKDQIERESKSKVQKYVASRQVDDRKIDEKAQKASATTNADVY